LQIDDCFTPSLLAITVGAHVNLKTILTENRITPVLTFAARQVISSASSHHLICFNMPENIRPTQWTAT